jgi:hypothetical protein
LEIPGDDDQADWHVVIEIKNTDWDQLSAHRFRPNLARWRGGRRRTAVGTARRAER